MRLIMITSLIVFSVGIQNVEAQRVCRIYKHKSKTCNKGYLSGDYKYHKYGQDHRVGGISVVAKADVVVNVDLTKPESTKVVRFHVPVSGIKTDRVSLDRIGLAIRDNGQAIFTGILNQNGGVDGGLSGSNVKIRARAYAGVRDADTLGDAVMVWKSEYENWVYKNRPLGVTFSNADYLDPKLVQFFQEITHMEIELEYTINR